MIRDMEAESCLASILGNASEFMSVDSQERSPLASEFCCSCNPDKSPENYSKQFTQKYSYLQLFCKLRKPSENGRADHTAEVAGSNQASPTQGSGSLDSTVNKNVGYLNEALGDVWHIDMILERCLAWSDSIYDSS